VLDEFQVVFITRGQGSFVSASAAATAVHASDILLLYPGEWHAYEPDRATGWSEYWVGFRGHEAARIMEAFFPRNQPQQSIVHGEVLIRHFDRLLGWLEQPGGAHEQLLASHIPLILACILASRGNALPLRSQENQLVMRAKAHMLADMQARTDFAALAKQLGISYSSFRFAFKRQTGYGPREFENLMRLNRARDLLLREGKSVAETATALGFSSIYYFSRAYKRQFGCPPSRTRSCNGKE
jgi:AraC-like DNA-binding protein